MTSNSNVSERQESIVKGPLFLSQRYLIYTYLLHFWLSFNKRETSLNHSLFHITDFSVHLLSGSSV